MLRHHVAATAILLLTCVLPSGGCAAMFHGTKDTVHLSSAEPDTRFYVDSRQVGQGTSAIVEIPKKGNGGLLLYGKKDGCQDAVSEFEVVFDGLSMLGVVLDFGVISILVVDGLATGAVTKSKYDRYTLTPTGCR